MARLCGRAAPPGGEERLCGRGAATERLCGRAAPPGGAERLCGRRALLPQLCLALLLLLLLLPPPGRALPSPRTRLAAGLDPSRQLLAAANASLQSLQDLSTLGFECTLEEVDLEDITENQINTIKACTSEDPGAGNCPTLEKSTSNMSKCLQGIYEDLNAYRAELKNFNDQDVLTSIDEMMKALQPGSRSVPPAAAGTGLASFKGRMRLCSILHAFRIRTVTINRMMNYLNSLESSL